MRGRYAKPPELRRRRNRLPAGAMLMGAVRLQTAPALPKRRPDRRAWHRTTAEWWRIVWASPMASEYLESDVPGLLMLAVLRDDFARDPKPSLAGEIRQQEQRFGLSPIDRRRLQWEVERVESAARKAKPANVGRADPRAVLQPVVQPVVQ